MNDSRLLDLFGDPIPPDRLAQTDHPKRDLLRRCLAALPAGGIDTVQAHFVPGRVEVLGKHTDYCGGRSLLCAVDLGFSFVARPNPDRVVRMFDVLRGEQCEIAIDAEDQADAASGNGHWSNYPTTVVRRMARNFGREAIGGMEIAFYSDLPPAAGMSSSSALMIGVFLGIATAYRLDRSPIFAESIQTLEDLAHYCGCIENGSGFRALSGARGVGTSGGSQDHTAILCCRGGMISQYSFAPVTHERDIPFPDGVSLVVLDSGVQAEKTGSACDQYNAVARRARVLVDLWNRVEGGDYPTLAGIVRSRPDATRRLSQLVASADDLPFERRELHDRLDQFVNEAERIIPQAGDALLTGNLDRFAALVAESTSGTIDKLRNQIPQTIRLIESALHQGALAASPFGAGFGGSVWTMVHRDRQAEYVESMQALAAGVHPVAASSGVRAIR